MEAFVLCFRCGHRYGRHWDGTFCHEARCGCNAFVESDSVQAPKPAAAVAS